MNGADEHQDLASENFLDPNDGMKDVREWAKAGLDYTEMLPYMPVPPTGRFTNFMNPNFVEMVIVSREYLHLQCPLYHL